MSEIPAVETTATTDQLPARDGLFHPNLERYERCAKDHETDEAASKAIDAFLVDLMAIREKHGIPDILLSIGAYVKGNVMVQGGFFGNPQELGLHLDKVLRLAYGSPTL
jgi:hypothetical protein